jgi:hypothetical protein
MKWVHIDFWWNKRLNKKEIREFEKILANFIYKNIKYINRKFYLYEPIPHCFLALEVREKDIWRFISPNLKAPFIRKVLFNQEDATDSDNGEFFLNILNAFTNYWLFSRKPKLTHIIHCCLELSMGTRKNENLFYKYMAKLYPYGTKRSNTKKKISKRVQ